MQHRPPARRRRLEHVAQAPPFGAHHGMELFRPVDPRSGRRVRCRGWAWPFDDQRVRRVALTLDGEPAGDAVLTLRPDIAEALDLPDAMLSGFVAELDLPDGGGMPRELTAAVHGLSGTGSTGPAAIVPADPAELPDDPLAGEFAATPAAAPRDVGAGRPGSATDRELARRRLGYDPWHRLVLIDERDAPLVAGVAVAALDIVAERHPSLELLVAGVEPESVFDDFLRRAIEATGLADRVTVPRATPAASLPSGGWAALADASLDTSAATDLAAAIDQLSAIAGT